jgi:hypothetical protein
MKNLKILFAVNLLLLIWVNQNLSYYGKGYNVFRHKLLYGFNTDYDSLEGFKIEDEEFIQVIGSGTDINESIKVGHILKYAEHDSGIFVEFMNSNSKEYVVRVVYDKKGELGNQIKYQLVSNSTVNNHELRWYNVYDSAYARVLVILNLVFKISLLLIILMLVYKMTVSRKRPIN